MTTQPGLTQAKIDALSALLDRVLNGPNEEYNRDALNMMSPELATEVLRLTAEVEAMNARYQPGLIPTDDLIARLRMGADYAWDSEPMFEAADRIAALEAELVAANARTDTADADNVQLVAANLEWAEVSQRNYKRAKTAREDTLEEIAAEMDRHQLDVCSRIIRTLIKEPK